MLRKEISLSDYLNEVFTELNKFCYSGSEDETIEDDILHAHARMFLNIFGEEVAENLVKAYDDEDTTRDFDYEYYRTLVSLYKNFNEADAIEFMDYLRRYCNNNKNKQQ